MHSDTIHLPQNLRHVAIKAGSMFVEVIAIPALILASLGGAGQLTVAMICVFAWRILAAVFRWSMFGLLPATCVLTFALLSARTGAGTVLGINGSESGALTAYLLPGSIVGFVGGGLFLWSMTQRKPLAAKLAKDFIHLTAEQEERLYPVFSLITFIIGAVHMFSAIVGALILFTADSTTATLVSSALSCLVPVLLLFLCGGGAVYQLRRMRVKVSFKAMTTQPKHDSMVVTDSIEGTARP